MNTGLYSGEVAMAAGTAVIGLGNQLLKDDGIGPRVVQELKKSGLPPHIKIIEAGGSFFSYWDLLLECSHVVAVDSMQGGGTPGSVYMLTPGQLNDLEPATGVHHEVHFLEVLKMASFFSARPEVVIIGIEPQEISFCVGLSPPVAAKLPGVVKAVKTILDGWINPA